MESKILEEDVKKFTPEFVIEKISEALMGAEKIRAVVICFSVEKGNDAETFAAAIGNPFDLLSLSTKSVTEAAETISISCVKKLMGKVDVNNAEDPNDNNYC